MTSNNKTTLSKIAFIILLFTTISLASTTKLPKVVFTIDSILNLDNITKVIIDNGNEAINEYTQSINGTTNIPLVLHSNITLKLKYDDERELTLSSIKNIIYDETLTGYYIDYINMKKTSGGIGYDIRPLITNYNINKTNFKQAFTATVCSLYNDSNTKIPNADGSSSYSMGTDNDGDGNYNVKIEEGKSQNFISVGASNDSSRSVEKYPHEMKYTVKCKQWGKNANNKNFYNSGWSNVADYDQIFEISFKWKYPEGYIHTN